MPKDLSSFLEEYEKQYPSQVAHVDREIDAKWEVTALAVKMEKEYKETPVLIFHKVRTASGEISKYPSVINLFASRKRCAYATGSTFERVGIDIWDRGEKKIAPVRVDRSNAPVKEQIFKGSKVDLSRLPALVHHYWDPGPYLSIGFLTVYDPDSGIDNSSVHRGWMSSRNEIRFFAPPGQHSCMIMDKIESKGEMAKVAYWVGHHPAACMGAQRPMPFPMSHFETAGGVLGEPLRVVPSETLGENFLVPADAEFVIEGVVPLGVRKPEGPFGEAYGHYGAQRLGRIMQVTAITCRRNAYWLSLMVGHRDFNAGIGGIQGEGVVYNAIKREVPTVLSVCRAPSFPGHVYIKIRKTHENQPRMALLAALSAWGSIKHAFVFDDDVDIFDESEVLWAIGSRTQWDKDLIVIPNCGASPVDPSTEIDGLGTKGGIDCTKPAPPKTFEKKISIPDEVMKRIRIEDFVKGRDQNGA